MLGGAPSRATTAGRTKKAGCGVGPEIIAKLATVLEVEPAELLRVPAGGRELNTWSAQSGIRSRNYLIFAGHFA
jgi:hypothetical protein